MKIRIAIITTCLLVVFTAGCKENMEVVEKEEQFKKARIKMVQEQIVARNVTDEAVLNAMRKVKRHLFVPEEKRIWSYSDRPHEIGHRQTISQPYIVALMTELAHLTPESKVLEIGTGSGYQAGVLAEIAKEVYTIEIIEPLHVRAKETLLSLGYNNIRFKLGDGYHGWEEYAPFDAIIVTAAPPKEPQPLIAQLKNGGRMIIPVGEIVQELVVITRTKEGIKRERIIPVRFVPMTGEAEKQKDK